MSQLSTQTAPLCLSQMCKTCVASADYFVFLFCLRLLLWTFCLELLPCMCDTISLLSISSTKTYVHQSVYQLLKTHLVLSSLAIGQIGKSKSFIVVQILSIHQCVLYFLAANMKFVWHDGDTDNNNDDDDQKRRKPHV